MAFLKSHAGLERPDIQYYLVPIAMNRNGSESYFPSYHGYNIHWCGLRPQSRGEVSLRSCEPGGPAAYLQQLSPRRGGQAGQPCMPSAWRANLHQQRAFDPYRGDELDPGPSSIPTPKSTPSWPSSFPRTTIRSAPARWGSMTSRGRSATSRPRTRGLESGRCIRHAASRGSQHQCANDHDRRAGGRPNQRYPVNLAWLLVSVINHLLRFGAPCGIKMITAMLLI